MLKGLRDREPKRSPFLRARFSISLNLETRYVACLQSSRGVPFTRQEIQREDASSEINSAGRAAPVLSGYRTRGLNLYEIVRNNFEVFVSRTAGDRLDTNWFDLRCVFMYLGLSVALHRPSRCASRAPSRLVAFCPQSLSHLVPVSEPQICIKKRRSSRCGSTETTGDRGTREICVTGSIEASGSLRSLL